MRQTTRSPLRVVEGAFEKAERQAEGQGKNKGIHSDEGLFESFTVANLPYRPCG